MEYYLLGALYVVLLGFGIPKTWKFVADTVLAGASGIILPIVLFVVAILIAGPFVGLYNLIKMAVIKIRKPKAEPDSVNQR